MMNRERTLEVLFPRQDQRCDRDGNDERSVTNLDPSTSEKAEPDAETGDLRRALANTSANTPMEASSRETHRTVSLGRGDSKRDLPSQDISDSKVICVICLERIGESQRVSGLCQHSFHYDCLMEWMKKNHDDCPTCRQALWDKDTFQAILRECDGTDMIPQTTGHVDQRDHQTIQQQRPPEMAGFPWCRVCYVTNALLFIAGAGYLILSMVLASKNSGRIAMEESFCSAQGTRRNISIGTGSCQEGNMACFQAIPCIEIGFSSCNGVEACKQLRVNVGNNSCNGFLACRWLRVGVGDNACLGNQACACSSPMWGIPGFSIDDAVPNGRCNTEGECCMSP